jgi:hypothetical protein
MPTQPALASKKNMHRKNQGTQIYIARGHFVGIKGQDRPYPAWRYHKFFEPKLVRDTAADYQASIEGWKAPGTPQTAMPHLVNWRYDLEDMNADQLRIFRGLESARHTTDRHAALGQLAL